MEEGVIAMPVDIKLDCSKMSSLTKQLLGSSILAGLVEHFNNPENQRKFEEWKEQRAKAQQQESEVKTNEKHCINTYRVAFDVRRTSLHTEQNAAESSGTDRYGIAK